MAMKVAISVPDPIFKAGEHLAKHLRLSRSQLYANALSAYLGSRGAAAITAKLNEVYATESSAMDPALRTLQLRSLSHEAW
jgi:predicted transcriptional regulator